MRITTYGAAEEVTGSKHLLEVNGRKILFDCGLFQGKRAEAAEKNRQRFFSADEINAVVLSHAHIDHSGTLPMLTRYGYQGPIYATPATRDLCAVMLLDSARIQERDAKWLSKKHMSFVPPLYDEEDARAVTRRFICVPYDMPMEIAGGVRVTFKDAGHVLGSAMVLAECRDNGSRKRFLYSGDIGRKNMPILADPWEPDDADVVVMESTYGDRDHDPIETLDAKLADVITRTYERGGKVIVPSFALERAQELVYALKRLEMANRIPDIPVYVDSPLTVNITEVFRLHTDLFDDEMKRLMERTGDPFQLKRIRYIRNQEESMELNERHEPMLIISAAGMCEYGRILHHLRNNIEDKRNTVLIVGFQAKNTLGRQIVERSKEVRIFGIKHALNAEVKTLNALSAHAGRSELLAFGKRFKSRAERVLLVHGETTAISALKSGLEAEGCANVSVQHAGIPFEF
ncbi:MAG TPA: MBL fold metallo-hydrolase [Candidatus Hydrogenedentes bacterium]|nr:MBL fold metallo-hydrolase [Candidatus Hydrogenedentota bacterium]HPG68001.1 MBL fold metallo-hydrolase [Candidatus Hydrogenedentota bacterium]